jgi:hypothetical protein
VNHVLIGAAIPLLVCGILYAARGGRASLRLLVVGPIVMGCSGAWAVVPDMPRAIGDLQWYQRIHHSKPCNVFWFHCAIDKVETDTPLYAVGFVTVAALLLFVAWRELRRAERGDAARGAGG